MFPSFYTVPVWWIVTLVGAAFGAAFSGKNIKINILCAVLAAIAAALLGRHFLPAATYWVPVQNYGLLMLTGFSITMGVCEYRARQIGIGPWHVLDMSLTGAIICLLCARIFYVVMNWNEFNPMTPHGFDYTMIVRMIKLWEGGLVFYGAFLAAFPWIYIYCRNNKIPMIPLMDLIGSGFTGGLMFGRLGCFATGCCFGRTCALPWAITFPKDSPAYMQQLRIGMIQSEAARSLPVHPTQLYSALTALLTYLFLILYWPRRKYDGQILALTMIMAGATRFFEEILRADDAPAFPKISASWTIAQFVGLGLVLVGFGLLFFFKKRNKLERGPN